MCGRFSIAKSKEEIAKRFNVGTPANFKPRYNVAPLQQLPVITSKKPNEISMMRWGLVPSWSLDASTAANMINARGESVFVKFHWNPRAGTHSLDWDEAVKISGADPDFHRRDLWEAIEGGAYPEWELGLQVFTEEQADNDQGSSGRRVLLGTVEQK